MPADHAGRGAQLRKNQARILENWEKKVRESLPLARRQDRGAILDALPEFLDKLADILSHPRPPEALREEEARLAREHGEQRARISGYSLTHVIQEYEILSRVILDVLDEEEPLDPAERGILFSSILLAVRNTADRYYDIKERRWYATENELKSHIQEKGKELWRTRELFQHLVVGVKDYAIFTVDPNGFVTTWNDGATRMKEYKPEEIVGEHFSRLYPPDARERDEPMLHLRQALDRGRFRGEGWRMKKSGEMFLADVCITPMFEGREHIGFSKVVQDLTERNHIVQEHELSRGHVSQLQAERDLRDQFVFALSHDLRTPLTAAKLSAQMITRESATKEYVQKGAKQVIDSLDRADALIRNFLDASRIKAGEPLPILVRKSDISAVAREAIGELISLYGNRFRLLGPQSIEGYWDPDGIRRILENLGSNGVKYGTERDPVTITLLETERQVQLSVHNSGPAIPREDQQTLFDLFRRRKATRAETSHGWGIGLNLVRGIAEAHGGSVRIESVEGEGTTFKVDLPKDARATQSIVTEQAS
jgi:PAS domain S-box-containing protein